jgi:hypothetical protein
MLTIAEELLLIALDDTKGKVISSQWGTVLVHSILERCLIGAILVELAFRERLELQQDHLVVTDPSPTGVAVLDETLDIVRQSEKRRSPRDWIQKLGRNHQGLEKRLLDGLVQRRILREEEGRFLWVFPTRRYPTEDDGPERSVRERVSAFLGGDPPDPHTLLLVRLVSACKLVELIAAPGGTKEAEERIQTYREDPDAAAVVATATTKQIEEDLEFISTVTGAAALS